MIPFTKKKSTASVLASFQKVYDELDAIVARESMEINAKNDLIDRLKDQCQDHMSEKLLAGKVAIKIRELIAA